MKTLQIIMLLSIVFIANGCKKSKQTLTIGQSYQGGIIAYIDQTGQHGLIVSESDLTNSIWGCSGAILGAVNKTYGNGLVNTNIITGNCSYIASAALLCSNLTLNGFGDWFLPTIDELQLMYQNLYLKGKGNFATDLPYWSSSEALTNDVAPNVIPSIHAWRIGMSGGGWTCVNKDGLAKVRPCRYF